ncbi:Arc family DNA-binding protein [Salmonella enterica subsp. enterica]|nr:Arc family DNA-binding protein [Salmonella enterica subsp. enterica]ECI0980210.1 Arc family DNA-binding protein [Salmonella enterica subsp. enterica serovar Newport]ECI2306519.1 Arc family DNA-binding protein [Salmonella enterica subsp. enterica serovar Infantis]ECO0902152.1 Arc family DNA-binding protein [Salmonella enterica subsp. enterica serovar Newport]EDQ2991406.1 Arc family DNA-binding protein [Salmonella enterica subsp. enterica]
MKEKQVKNYDKFNLRFPDGMRSAIAVRAKSNGRSMNAEIIQILDNALKYYPDDKLVEYLEEVGSSSLIRKDGHGGLTVITEPDDIAEYIEEKTEEFKRQLIEAVRTGKMFVALAP